MGPGATAAPNGSQIHLAPPTSQLSVTQDLRAKLVQILSASANGCLAELGYDPHAFLALKQRCAEWQSENVKLYDDNTRLSESYRAVKDQLTQLQQLHAPDAVLRLQTEIRALRENNEFLKKKIQVLETQQPGQPTYAQLFDEYNKLSLQANVTLAHCKQCPIYHQQLAMYKATQNAAAQNPSNATQNPGQNLRTSGTTSNPASRPSSQPAAPVQAHQMEINANSINHPQAFQTGAGSQPSQSLLRTGVASGGNPFATLTHIASQNNAQSPSSSAGHPHYRSNSLPAGTGFPGPPQPVGPSFANSVSSALRPPQPSASAPPGPSSFSNAFSPPPSASTPTGPSFTAPFQSALTPAQPRPVVVTSGHALNPRPPSALANLRATAVQGGSPVVTSNPTTPSLPWATIPGMSPFVNPNLAPPVRSSSKPPTPANTIPAQGDGAPQASTSSSASVPSPPPAADVSAPQPPTNVTWETIHDPSAPATPAQDDEIQVVEGASASTSADPSRAQSSEPAAKSMKRPLEDADLASDSGRSSSAKLARMSIDLTVDEPSNSDSAELADQTASNDVPHTEEPVDASTNQEVNVSTEGEQPTEGVQEALNNTVGDEEDEDEIVRIGPDGLRLVTDCLSDIFRAEGGGKLCQLCEVRYTSGHIDTEPPPFMNASDDDLVAHCLAEHEEVWHELRSVDVD